MQVVDYGDRVKIALVDSGIGLLPAAAAVRRLRPDADLVLSSDPDSLLHLAFRTDPAGDEALVGETRTLLHAYFAHTFDRPPGGPGG